MKTKIKHQGMWWSWEETCDKCNKLIHSDGYRSSEKPDAEEVDFCVDCLRELMDNHIPYEEAKKKYGKEK